MVAWKSNAQIKDVYSVLIITKDKEMASVWETLFQQKDCYVLHETSPKEALQSAQLLCPSLIVLDLDLPQSAMLDLCKKLRATTNGTLLLLAPVNGQHNIFEYMHAGVDEHIPTPISPMALLIKSMAWLVKQEWASN
ncbi:MAG: response regulator [Anaerolineales bacterium]